jgi:predicted O-methyltransferase YrrM
MYSTFHLTKKYLRYYLAASNSKGHGMHSPFVFDFILNVLNNKNEYNSAPEIEKLRRKLLQDDRMLTIEDLGAGSRVQPFKQRTIKSLARTAVKSKKYSQLLYRLAKHYQPQDIIELGTSLGITTVYFSKANPLANIITIEGSKPIAEIAKDNFQKIGCTNIQSLIGNFDGLLPSVLEQFPAIDLAYIDGNHRLAPTLNYFEQFLSKTNNNSILIFDDIHWSNEMEEAWEKIKAHPSVRCTVDIFFLGFVFFRQEFKEKQHFTVRF